MNLPQGLNAVQLGHADIHENGIKGRAVDSLDGGCSVIRLFYLPAPLLEHGLQHDAMGFVVIDDENGNRAVFFHCCQQAWGEILGILPLGIREGLDTFG
jgi:hypothetical protein